MSSRIYYPGSTTSVGNSYLTPEMTGALDYSNGSLRLRFQSANAAQDAVELVLDDNQRNALWVGRYALKSVQDASAAVQATYTLTYSNPPAASISKVYTASSNNTVGSVTLTHYDQSQRLLSGTYSIEMTNAADPYADTTPGNTRRTCTISVAGEFANMPML